MGGFREGGGRGVSKIGVRLELYRGTSKKKRKEGTMFLERL